MKRFAKMASVMVIAAVSFVLGAATEQETRKVVFVDSAMAEYKDVGPGVEKMVLWGNPDKGSYGAFTKFAPGATNPMHSHTNDIRTIVIKGAYVYKPIRGEEMRVGPGSFLFVPGGEVHVSGGDSKEGALFYEESTGKFDLNPVVQN
jgi:quercetin dioxygenase-like cupin family protein